MGEVRSRVREITKEEFAALKSHSAPGLAGAKETKELRVLEFDIAIDSVTTYLAESDDVNDAVAERPLERWQEQVQCYVLGVGSKTVGFELCFMKFGAIGTGSFPSDHVRVAFAVRPSLKNKGEWEELTRASWPVSYHWYGKAIEVKRLSVEVSRPSWEDVLPIYRVSAMQEAERCS